MGDWLKEEKKKIVAQGGPGIEFEGPLGCFWPLEDVPDTALFRAMRKLAAELQRRGHGYLMKNVGEK